MPRWGGLRARHISMGDGVDFKLVTSGFTTFPGLRSRRDRASCYPASRYSWSLSAVSSGLTAKTWEDLLRNLSPPLKIYYQPLVSSNSSLLLRTLMQCCAFWSLLSQSSSNVRSLPSRQCKRVGPRNTRNLIFFHSARIRKRGRRQGFVLNHFLSEMLNFISVVVCPLSVQESDFRSRIVDVYNRRVNSRQVFVRDPSGSVWLCSRVSHASRDDSALRAFHGANNGPTPARVRPANTRQPGKVTSTSVHRFSEAIGGQ